MSTKPSRDPSGLPDVSVLHNVSGMDADINSIGTNSQLAGNSQQKYGNDELDDALMKPSQDYDV